MKAYLLVGDLTKKNDYVRSFIEENNISSYNIIKYVENLKISEVRDIKMRLSTSSGKKRLLLVEGPVTLDAQNALLKTLEETPDETDFIFFNEDLIPTVVSRCHVVNLGLSHNDTEDDMVVELGEDASSLLLFSDRLFKEENTNFEQIQKVLREALLANTEKKDYKRVFFFLDVLKEYIVKSELIKNNNLNNRLVLEKILIASFSENEANNTP